MSDSGIASCFDAGDGTRHWMERLGGGHSASAITANGLAYFVSDRGITTVIRPGKEFEVVAKNDLKESQLLALHQSIASFNVPAQYANAFIGERCVTISAEGIARTGSPAEIQRIDNEGFLLEEKLIQHLKTSTCSFTHFTNACIGYPNLPTSHEKYNEARETLAQISERNKLISGNSNPKYILSQMLLKTFTKETGKDSKHWRWALQQQLAGTAIAIERLRSFTPTLGPI